MYKISSGEMTLRDDVLPKLRRPHSLTILDPPKNEVLDVPPTLQKVYLHKVANHHASNVTANYLQRDFNLFEHFSILKIILWHFRSTVPCVEMFTCLPTCQIVGS